jgi:glycosyltransferase involved in cell wall biosynthesis
MLGRLSWEKGFDIGLKAFSLLKANGSNALLNIIGGGGERANLEQLVKNLKLEDSVRFLGVLSRDEVSSTINQATIVLAPSILESFGLSILEAQQLQRPVIATRVQGIPEVISEGESGWLVPMNDPKSLAEAMGALLKNPEEAIKMGIQGRITSIEKFTIARNATEYEEVYQECLQNH